MCTSIAGLIHVAVVLVLSMTTMSHDVDLVGVEIELVPTTKIDEPVVVIATMPTPAVQPSSLSVSAFKSEVPEMLIAVPRDVTAKIASGTSERSAGAALGKATPGAGTGLPVSCFGIESQAHRVVYLLDASSRMRGEPFVVAAREVVGSVQRLDSTQEFTAVYGRLGPRGIHILSTSLLPATEANCAELAAWLDDVKPVGTFDPHRVIDKIVAMDPELIFLFTDGNMHNGTFVDHLDAYDRPPVLHVILFNNRRGEPWMKGLARRYGGTYRFVETAETPGYP
ncbi:MAG: hypothetical protein O3C40_24640 [Planctomycetota bacterium]|nr:hypothetical protein [Planctomycetota bacterium]